jgi:hypothetical protein
VTVHLSGGGKTKDEYVGRKVTRCGLTWRFLDPTRMGMTRVVTSRKAVTDPKDATCRRCLHAASFDPGAYGRAARAALGLDGSSSPEVEADGTATPTPSLPKDVP